MHLDVVGRRRRAATDRTERSLRFEYRLTPLEQYEPWNAERAVSWFELTDGEQVVRLGEQEIFSSQISVAEEHGQRRWLDYSVVRMWEDLLELFPYAKEPVPREIARRLDPGAGWDSWRDQAWKVIDAADGSMAAELEEAFNWGRRRTLDVGHLVAAPRLTFARVDDIVIVTCEPRGDTSAMGWHWLCEPARVELPLQSLVDEVERFSRTLLAEMAQRVAASGAGALAGRAIVDLTSLNAQHVRREEQLAAALRAVASEDEGWDRISHALHALDRAIGQ
ncbi:DUF5984 family protein [Sandaracinus amylolyticus]|uniref:DUF5984 family protein n=1 Tax=Sandaracinus amylolyticus TaxID=927083 RepID=UPI0022A706E2|nr:DUF5984 family protein [Sandaracinus amylolyticus]UJR83186.1 Hypothetical protein I5071_52520 [Sandaracinus amylolyticus]